MLVALAHAVRIKMLGSNMPTSLEESADQPPHWDIYRFELVFFNSKENRWQLFQEETGGPHRPPEQVGAFYRQQIQAMLGAIRLAVTEQCKKSKAFVCSPIPTNMGEIITPDLSPLHTFFKESERFRSLFDKIRTKIKSSLNSEELTSEPYEDLWNYIVNGGNPVELSRGDALSLLSVLPIAKHWDVYGRLYFPKNGRVVLQKTKFQRKFCYKLSFGTKEDLRPDCSRAERVLGYSVQLEFPAAWKEHRHHNRDLGTGYYDFAEDVCNEGEEAWYGFFGLLVDALQRRLDPTDEQLPKAVWIISYPLRICGWDHAVQLYARPLDGKSPNAWQLEAEWEDQGGLCGNDNSHDAIVFKECLRELLVQIRIAAFQFSARRDSSDDVFCRQSHNLVKMEWLSNGERYYGYPPSSEDDPTPGWGIVSRQGAAPEGHLATIQVNPSISANIPWEEKYAGPLDPLFLETGRQRLSEQLEWLKVGRISAKP